MTTSGHAQVVQGLVDRRFAVAAVGGHGAGDAAGAGDHPGDGGGELWRVWRVALVEGVVDDQPVDGVDDLGLVTELDRSSEPALGDRPGVAVVQADPPARPSGVRPASRCRVCATI
jgi:hypothetical protein